jgi:tRNA (guanine-N7-)-methyltransferase
MHALNPVSEELPHRPIRSFVRREGRMTPAQQRALEELWPRYGVDVTDEVLDLDSLFDRRAPCILEIGFGNGDALLAMARENPQHNYLGIEVHRPGVGRLLQRLADEDIRNVRVICADAVEVLERNIPRQSLAAVHLFFPDPWPKKKHHKRRIVQPSFVSQVAVSLMPGGIFHMATDWHDYAGHMLDVMRTAPGFVNVASSGNYAGRPAYRPATKFEQRGKKLGHGVWDLIYKKEN